MTYTVNVREVGPIKAMTIRTITGMKTVSEDMGRTYGELWTYLTEKGAQCAGECFAIYHDEECDPDRMDVECGFSVVDLVPGNDRVTGRVVEGGLMAYTLHQGPYLQLEAAYTAVMRWIAENGYVPLPKMRDVYLNDPQEVPQEELRTEILWPVKKK